MSIYQWVAKKKGAWVDQISLNIAFIVKCSSTWSYSLSVSQTCRWLAQLPYWTQVLWSSSRKSGPSKRDRQTGVTCDKEEENKPVVWECCQRDGHRLGWLDVSFSDIYILGGVSSVVHP